MIQNKREEFRTKIRRSNNEQQFKLKRQQYIIPTQTIANLCEQLKVARTEQSLEELNQLICDMPQHIQNFLWLLDINQDQNILYQTVQIFYNLIGNSTEQQLEDTEQLVEFLSAIIYDAQNYDISILGLIFETLHIAATRSLYWAGCSARLIPSLITILPQVRIEYQDEGMWSLLALVTVMLAQQSKLPSTATKDCILILNIISKKLHKIEYLSLDEETQLQIEDGQFPEYKLNVLIQLMTAAKYYFDKHEESNVCNHKSLLGLIRDCALHQQSSLRLKRVALNVIQVLTTLNSITQVLQKFKDIVVQLIFVLQLYQQQIGEAIKIRVTVSIALINLIANKKCHDLLNQNEIAQIFIDLHAHEYNLVVFTYQLQSIDELMSDPEIFQLFIERNIISSTCCKLQQSMEEMNRLTLKYCLNVVSHILSNHNDVVINNCRQNKLDILLQKLVYSEVKSISARAEQLLESFQNEESI